MELLLFLLFVLVPFCLLLAFSRHQSAEHARLLSRFSSALDGGHGQTQVRVSSGLSGAWVRGRLRGRRVSLSFERRGRISYTIYAVDVDHAAADFSLSRADLPSWLRSLLGLPERVDVHPALSAVVVNEGSTAVSRRLLQEADLATALRGLFDAGFSSVQLSGGRLSVEQQTVGPSTLELEALRGVFTKLVDVAALCERRPVAGKVEGLSVRPRFAWTAGGQRSLCPFCRDEVKHEDPGGDDVSACDRCGTLHHRACFDEAGGCTIFGCGRRDARVTERA